MDSLSHHQYLIDINEQHQQSHRSGQAELEIPTKEQQGRGGQAEGRIGATGMVCVAAASSTACTEPATWTTVYSSGDAT